LKKKSDINFLVKPLKSVHFANKPDLYYIQCVFRWIDYNRIFAWV